MTSAKKRSEEKRNERLILEPIIQLTQRHMYFVYTNRVVKYLSKWLIRASERERETEKSNRKREREKAAVRTEEKKHIQNRQQEQQT